MNLQIAQERDSLQCLAQPHLPMAQLDTEDTA